MLKEILDLIDSGEVPVQYSDPQEFMWSEERTEASDVYSYAMLMFCKITEKDYFDFAGIPADEFFMMADPDSSKSVIDRKYIPEEYAHLADLLAQMTVYSRNERITLSDAAEKIRFFCIQAEEKNNEICSECISEYDKNGSDAAVSESGKYTADSDYDYGIILNNKRSGRIEFRPLVFHDGRTDSCDIPVAEPGKFIIAVSKRHRDYAGISNPSSVFGDCIIPVDTAVCENMNQGKAQITAGITDGEIVIYISASGSAEKTKMKWGHIKC